MPKTRLPFPAEVRRQVVALARAGRDPTDLAREFESSAQAIGNWVSEADRQEERREAKAAGGEIISAPIWCWTLSTWLLASANHAT